MRRRAMLMAAALAMLRRQGWTRNDLKPGDMVAVSFHPYRSGDSGGMTLSVRLENGRVLGDQAARGPGTAPPNAP